MSKADNVSSRENAFFGFSVCVGQTIWSVNDTTITNHKAAFVKDTDMFVPVYFNARIRQKWFTKLGQIDINTQLQLD